MVGFIFGGLHHVSQSARRARITDFRDALEVTPQATLRMVTTEPIDRGICCQFVGGWWLSESAHIAHADGR